MRTQRITKSILKYPGSKWSIVNWIIGFFPEHHSYLEPKLIGESCTGFEQVYPRRLYKELGQSAVYGRRVHMLVDEDGYRKELPINLIASWLYGTDIHQNPILGDVLIVREVLREGSIDIIGLEKRQGMELFQKFMLFS